MKLIQQARILTKGNETEAMNVLLDERQIVKITKRVDPTLAQEVIPAENCILLSGLIDIHTHLREPDYAHRETIASGTAAVAHGSLTTIMTMPNVIPYPDNTEAMKIYLAKIRQDSRIYVIPYACIIKTEASQKPNDMEGLSAMGIHAFSDDSVGVATAGMMKTTIQKYCEADDIVVVHTEDMSYCKPSAYMYESIRSRQLGLTGIPSVCEYAQFQWDLALVRETGCHYHVCHMSAQESVESLRRTKEEGLDVSNEVTAHHLLLNEMAVGNANHKMNPPLYNEEDRQALIQGLLDGTIDTIASDHTSHSEGGKSRGMEKVPLGIAALETAFPLLYTCFVKEEGVFTLKQLMYWMSKASAKHSQTERRGKLKEGNASDFILMDLNSVREIERQGFYSTGKSIPSDGIVCSGFAMRTLVDGVCVYDSRKGLLKWKSNH